MTLWILVHQAPLSVGFSRQEYWSGLPCPPPGALPDPQTEPVSLMSPALAGRCFTTEPPGSLVRTSGGINQGKHWAYLHRLLKITLL